MVVSCSIHTGSHRHFKDSGFVPIVYFVLSDSARELVKISSGKKPVDFLERFCLKIEMSKLKVLSTPTWLVKGVLTQCASSP